MHKLCIVALALLTTTGFAQAPKVEDLLEEAAQVATHSGEPQTRAASLAEIAVAWAPINKARYDELARQAVDCATGAPTEMAHALSLRTVALRLGKHDAKRGQTLLEEAAKLARELKSPIERAVALREIALAAQTLKLESAPALTTEALDAARKMPDPLTAGLCLRDLAADLRSSDPKLAAQAFSEAEQDLNRAQIAAGESLGLARAELAAAWAPLDEAAARRIIDALPDKGLRPVALRMVAAAVAATDPDLALSLAEGIAESPVRAQVIAAAAAGMSPELSATAEALGRSALALLGEAAGEVPDAARADIALALARTAPEDAVALARKIADPDRRNAALCDVAGRIGETKLQPALELLAQVDDPIVTEPVLVPLIRRLAETNPQDAATRARQLISRRLRVQALLDVAGALHAPARKP